MNKKYPKINYIGNKEKIASWICDQPPSDVDTVADVFSGGCSFAYEAKKRGYRVITNDILAINYQIALALIENNHETLNDDDVAMIFSGSPHAGFMSQRYAEKFYFHDECQQLDLYRKNIGKLDNQYKRALAFTLMRRAMIRKMPYTEDMRPGDTANPYGASKAMVERMLTDIQKADPRWSVILLRYFNPIGAHESGLIGEQPNGIPNNLLPYICQVASGRLPQLSVFGGDYPTPDGTGMRDYIHVMDLAEGHIAAMKAKGGVAGVHLFNLGSGRASSVLEIIRAFEAASGLTIPFEIKPRRAGDLACSFADPSHTKQQTGWETKRGLQQMMEDSWRWVSRNPNGYGD
ncbi:UDP-glucose 4-epimerase GalE [Neisseria meningitidis]|uniref:UDP-glucose 4-epimerase GalE n=1 Tax=Neisseria meningitidis TaxID=487 RepID=UPI000FCBD050|nr:UDP-glucose 4-epimerase GalE [Neisseria meningitidis]